MIYFTTQRAARGFTLIELMMVIAIIGLMSAIVMAMLSGGRAKGRDTQRLQAVKELQKAIELYYSDNEHYPALVSTANDARSRGTGTACVDGTEGDANWCALIAAIQPYYRGGLDDPTSSGVLSYYYDADGAQPQYYGLMAILETDAADDTAMGDGGFYCTAMPCASNTRGFEVGNEPSYCLANGWGDWRTGGTRMCSSVSSPTPP